MGAAYEQFNLKSKTIRGIIIMQYVLQDENNSSGGAVIEK